MLETFEAVSFDVLLGVTFHGYADENHSPLTQNGEPAPDGSDPSACIVGTAWLVQLSGSDGVSLRTLLRSPWIFEDLVPELLGGLSNGRAGTRALRAHAARLGEWADVIPPAGQCVYANVWYRVRPKGRRTSR